MFKPISYEAQLLWLQSQVIYWLDKPNGPEEIRALLSIAESVKAARDHAFNCPDLKFTPPWQTSTVQGSGRRRTPS